NFPRGLFNLLQATDCIADGIRSAGILQQPASHLRDVLQKHKFHDGDKHPQLGHLKHSDLLKGLDVRDEGGLTEPVFVGREKVLGQRRYSWNNGAIGSAHLRKFMNSAERSTSCSQFS